MMDKKSANGFSAKASESGGQRKQLPYSVETPYGFHLDLDFLKYVDDIEKGNTIKRVHIQRKNRGPKYSTLPRNFSLPGHGARPAAKDTWSNTSTLGSKPKSRVTEVQQLFDFRASSDNASSSSSSSISSQSTPAGQKSVQGSSYVSSPKPIDEVHIQASQDQQASLSLNVRPHLFRASSMPVNVPHRKASDSTDEQKSSQSQNGSTEKLFRPVDVSDRRGSIPQDRASLHQQITAALKRVRELEEQVRTIPELKAQICSLREEKEQLLQRIQAQSHVKSLPETEADEKPLPESQECTEPTPATEEQDVPSVSQDTVNDSHAKSPEIQSTVDKVVQNIDGPPPYKVMGEGPVLGVVCVPVILIEKAESPTSDSEESERMLEETEHEIEESQMVSEHESEKQEETPSTSLKDKESDITVKVSITAEEGDISEATVSQDETEKAETIDQSTVQKEKPTSTVKAQDVFTIQDLQEKVKTLEERLRQVSCDLETTTSLLNVQIEENRQKEVTIQELSEKVKEPIAQQESEGRLETEPLPGHIITCDSAVNTDSKHVLEKAVLTDTDLKPVDSIKKANQTSCSTQTNIVETREIEVLAQVTTAEKVVGVEIAKCDQAVETDVYENILEAKEIKKIEAADESCSVRRDDVDEEKMSESMLIERDVAEEYVIVEKTEDDLVETVLKDDKDVKSLAREKELVENVETVVIEAVKPDTSTDDPLQHVQKLPQGQDVQPQSQRPNEASASPAAIGQVVTRIQGLLNEQWASLGSGSQEPKGEGSQKQPVSKISSIQSHLRGSLSALSAFYSPVQKGGAAKQSGLKSIMKKNDCPDKATGGAKKNLKFVGVNGGYESTSSEESSGEDEREEEEEEEEKEVDSSEMEEQGEDRGVAQKEEKEAAAAGEQDEEIQAGVSQGSVEPKDPQAIVDPQEEQPSSEFVDKNFMAACHYLKDRVAEVSTPNKEMRQILMVLYQEWFRVSSQKESQAEMVTVYLREVGNHTPTLLRYIVNLADGNGNMALHYSVSHSNFQVVKLLLDTGLCEVNHQNKAGYTAIMLAALTAAEGPEDMEVAQQLLSLGNINAQASQSGQTALMLAISHGRTAMVQVLLDCNADVNIQDQDGSTALMCACEHGHTEIAKLLLDRPECNTNLKDK
ncbi:KN motif and ankyrin repeat domain-containing protein 4 isoform X1, partial [Clarias magur]